MPIALFEWIEHPHGGNLGDRVLLLLTGDRATEATDATDTTIQLNATNVEYNDTICEHVIQCMIKYMSQEIQIVQLVQY